MKVSRDNRPPDRGFFGKLLRKMGGRNRTVFFAEDRRFAGVGNTPQAAIADLRAERGRFAGTYVGKNR